MANRFEGKNLEEALTSAAQTLGVERYQLTYHVLLEKRGFLGGMKRVVIEAEVNDSAAPPAEEPVRSSAPPAGAPRRREGGEGPRARGERGERRERGGRGRRGRRQGERESQPPREAVDDDAVPVEIPPQGPESEAASAVHDFVDNVLRLARISAEARTEENDAQVIVRLYGRDARLLTDRHGELLDALQVVANKALTGRKVEKDIELDCAEFKARRMEELEEKARETAERVRRDGREQLLPAMSPVERRIVHLALADDAEVMTESRGEGFFKRVAIKRRPAASEQQPEP